MFLMVYVTLVIGIIGLFSQVYTLQAARMYANQNAIAKAMLAWHTTADALAQKTITNNVTTVGCALVVNGTTLPAGVTRCTAVLNGAGQSIYVGQAVTTAEKPLCVGTTSTNCWVDRATYSGSSAYAFYSIFYRDNSASPQYYVITFVPPPATDALGQSTVCLPGRYNGGTDCGGTVARNVGLGIDALAAQIRKSGVEWYSRGRVNAAADTLISDASTSASGVQSSLTYPLPTSNIVPANSLAYITTVAPCPNCN